MRGILCGLHKWDLVQAIFGGDSSSFSVQEEEAGIYDVHSSIWCRKKSWSRHQKCERRRRDFVMFTLLSGATRNPGHGTRNARGGGDFW